MPHPEDEVQLLRRRADDDTRDAIRALIAHTQQLDQRQTRLETAMMDIANYVVRSEQNYQAMQQQVMTLIEAQTRTAQQIISHMESEEKVWSLIQHTAEKMNVVEGNLSSITGLSVGQIDNLKTMIGGILIVLGSMATAAIGFAGYVITRIHP